MNEHLAKGVYNMEYTPSEGEEYISYFLEDNEFNFKQEVPIVNLKYDSKSHRRADFYLTDYHVYVEFFGRWNNTKKDRESYREKKKVFDQNNVPCIYIYPENLGVLDFSFYRRLENLLEQRNMHKELFKLRKKMFYEDYRLTIGFLVFSLLVLSVLLIDWDDYFILIPILLFAAIAVFQVFELIKGYIRLYRKGSR